ncbi:hypothetical protein, partial [Marinilactibacillus psychrotolerans]|uniref:hypothetical protein n=1 Tax=Marinilactibacillus psychrotolerans TaxID=191770 RepID=UPI001BB1226C
KVILRLFTEGERLAEPISLSKQRKTIKGKSDSRDFLQQLDTHFYIKFMHKKNKNGTIKSISK